MLYPSLKKCNYSILVIIFYILNLQVGKAENTISCDKAKISPPKKIIYKEIDTVKLAMEFNYPQNMVKGEKYLAIIFFFGGGWNSGSTDQFKPQGEFFAARGMVGIVADYRVRNRHGTTPFDAVKDAKSAIRFLRENAHILQIDTDRIVASGGSAGGHLAAATGIISGLEEKNENLQVSSKPNAMVLFNPVFDNGPEGYGYNRIGDRYQEISPLHNITFGVPPTIVFLGTNDRLIPVSTAELFRSKMEEAGNRCDLHLYEGQKHGFFNFKNPKNYTKTVLAAAEFLESIGYIHNLILYDLNRMIIAKQLAEYDTEPFASEIRKLKSKADHWFKIEPVSVMDKKMARPGGDMHDYYSLGRYWWPDPSKEDGLPYIRKDGVSNPELKKYDAPALNKMSEAVFTFALTWLYTGEKKYANKADEWLQTWFLQPETKMNPHLKYGQAIPGITEGRSFGIIETDELIEVAEAIEILEYSGVIDTDEKIELTKWYSDYTHWLLSSENGLKQRMWRNNHGTSYDAQVVAYAIFTNNDSVRSMILDSVKIKRIDNHFEADGSQPLELKRTKGMGYSLYNLFHYFRIAIMAENYKMNLWNYENSKGGRIVKGITYLIPFLSGKKEFPYQELGGLEKQIPKLKTLLRMNVHGWDDPEINQFLEANKDLPNTTEFSDLIFPVFE